MKPPSNNGYTTHTELNELKKIPLNKSFVKKFDNIESAFAKTAKDNNVENYDKKIAAKLIKDSAPVILELKKYHNRKRPYDLDSSLKALVLKSMQTPSYPSGHSVQGTGIAKLLADKYPKAKSAFNKTAKNAQNIVLLYFSPLGRLESAVEPPENSLGVNSEFTRSYSKLLEVTRSYSKLLRVNSGLTRS